MVLSTEWSQVEVIDLINDGNGLGFILVGGRSTGVVIKALTPGGVAERDARLQLGDHLLQIGEVNLRGFSSEQVATVLRQTGAQVRLIVARPIEPTAIDYQTLASHAPIIPTKLLSDPEELSRHLFQNPSFATAAIAAAAAAGGVPNIDSIDVASVLGVVRGGPEDGIGGNLGEVVGLPFLPVTPDAELADLPLPPIPADATHDGAAQMRQCGRDLDIVPFSILSPPPGPLATNTNMSAVARKSLQLPLHPLDAQVPRRQRQGCNFNNELVGDDDDDEDDDHIETVIAGISADKLTTTTTTPTPVDAQQRDDNDLDCCSLTSSNYMDSPETETYEVELRKNVYGLGITVAGYVCEEEDLSGIFVKSIIEGSAAEMSGQIQINDRIVAVDGLTLAGVTNHQAVELLRNTDIEVHLTLERFLRGRKFEHLQVALTELKGGGDTQSQLSMPASPSITTLSWLPPKSDADSIATDGDLGGGGLLLDFGELPSRDTVDSNMSHVLDRSEASGGASAGAATKRQKTPTTPDAKRLTNGSAAHIMGNGLNHIDKQTVGDDSGNDTDEQCQEPEMGGPMPTDETTPTAQMPGVALKSGVAATPTTAATAATPNSSTASPSAASLRVAWKSEFPESEILVAEINKLSGLGISLEGTVDVECGIEKRPHHYIRSILEDGPVGRQGILRPGDELLQVNEHKLQGLKHIEVVKILKELPARVKLVCARGPRAPSIINTSQNPEAFETRSLLPGGHQSLQNLLTKAQSESSLYTSSTATLTDAQRSKSLENVSGLALWSCDVTTVEIEKTEQGFGFSILDYQDPLDAEGSVIVIRGLIRGGAAEATNEIYPGDRLISVGEHMLQGLELDEAVSILKAMPLGITRLGICRPLSTSDSNSNIASPLGDSAST
ncbi:patj homolog [Scaptodrosophila lebanonensis]|uniref:Patj homolog n=1 Tax=Drosophila lebanonensis TaxID=7225 RepID=A0A6J2SZL4_DROLE|nr:patj homolog [Scaptodrosophila lebanonensis]